MEREKSLFHQSIKKRLLSKSRLYVHLSKDTDTAVKVGSRHGKPVVYRVAAGKMADDGYEFFFICKWSMAYEGCSGRVFKQNIVIYE